MHLLFLNLCLSTNPFAIKQPSVPGDFNNSNLQSPYARNYRILFPIIFTNDNTNLLV